ncbi:MAG: DNA polymerase I [bacterium]|nr:DNA polymerase I [bacterium]
MPTKKEKLLIIDGNALIHRSFHALPTTMKTKKGEVTNAVYGFTTVLIKALKEFKPEYIVLTLDKKGPTFRHKEYAEYKAKRVKAPDELYAQIPRVKDVARAFNIPIFELDGFEADDLIGTIATEIKNQSASWRTKIKNNIETIIVTGDMDTLQLVNDSTKVYTMSHGLADSLIYDEPQVAIRYNGLKPEQIVDYKALRGDPSDNIPGVAGIGEKGAIELIKEFGSLEKLYNYVESRRANVSSPSEEKIKSRTLELLKAHKKEAFLSQKLATIITDVPIDFELGRARTRDFDLSAVVKLFNELEFRSLLARLQELDKKLQPVNKTHDDEQSKFSRVSKQFDYQLIDDEKKFKKFLSELKKQKIFAYDTETSNFNSLEAELLGISFSWKKGAAYYIEVKNKTSETESQGDLFANDSKEEKKDSGLDVAYVIKNVQLVFENEKVKKICHNAKFDIEAIEAQGIAVKGVYFDTMVASYLLNPGGRQHGLDSVCFNYLNYQKISKDDLLGAGRNKIKFAEVKTGRLALYSCEDADFTFRLYEKFLPILKKEKLDKLFFEIEMPLIRALADMEQAGIKLDVTYLAKLQKSFAKQLNELTKKIHKIAGKTFNINSTQQLQEVLFEKLEIPTYLIKRTKTGYSTGADELAKLKNQHEIIDLISNYRELAKLQNTYIETLPELISKKDKRIHTSYNQTVAATGRLSSTDPNLQNIPIRTEEGKKIRRAFISQKGYKLVSADYSQIELRLAAAMSGDKNMIRAFQNKADIHSATAAAINEVKPEAVTPAMRREAKAINFGILYGQGPFGLSQVADIPQWKAKEFIDKYFATYSGVKKWIEDNIKKARKEEVAETLFGRIRKMPEINSSNIQIKKGAERIATNTPLQGTAADIMKIAMIEVNNELKKKFGADARVLLQVHDELVIEVKNDKIKSVAKIVKEKMETAVNHVEKQYLAAIKKVPIAVDVAVGDNWEEMEELK